MEGTEELTLGMLFADLWNGSIISEWEGIFSKDIVSLDA